MTTASVWVLRLTMDVWVLNVNSRLLIAVSSSVCTATRMVFWSSLFFAERDKGQIVLHCLPRVWAHRLARLGAHLQNVTQIDLEQWEALRKKRWWERQLGGELYFESSTRALCWSLPELQR